MRSDKGAQIIARAKELGAAVAGIASVEALKNSPSYQIRRKMRKDSPEIEWPSGAASAVVIAVSHPQDKPELDWWDPVGGSPGNRSLVRISRELSAWIEETLGLTTHPLPYSVGDGGAYLKDVAVLAGLGCIGRNNLLVTPELGPRVRLRAILLEGALPATGPIAFDPCGGCEEYCRKACPQGAFEDTALTAEEWGMTTLPGRDGRFSRARCMNQMAEDEDVDNSAIDTSEMEASPEDTEIASDAGVRVRYCRRCEFACPVGG